MKPPYYLGGPMWSVEKWKGTLYTRKASSKELLRQYARVFTSVEGNHTFYAMPSPDSVRRWASEVPEGFRFCFKVPRIISHESQLDSPRAHDLVDQFLRLLEPIAGQTGLVFLQLPPGFSGNCLGQLEVFLNRLPASFRFCVEARHPDYFDKGPVEGHFLKLLRELGMNRALFDTEVLHALAANSSEIREAQRKKPGNPARFDATGSNPFLRYVGYEEVEPNRKPLARIAAVCRDWILEGKRPFIFLHSPGDELVPEISECFHELLTAALGPVYPLEPLPEWPGRAEPINRQLDLF
ncbi:MAG: DUF72 domain-containing protein [Verrucomicrobiota bacterium]